MLPKQGQKKVFHLFEFVNKLSLETQKLRRGTGNRSVSAGLVAGDKTPLSFGIMESYFRCKSQREGKTCLFVRYNSLFYVLQKYIFVLYLRDQEQSQY